MLPIALLTKKLMKIRLTKEVKMQIPDCKKLSQKNILRISKLLKPRVFNNLISFTSSRAFMYEIIKLKLSNL